MPATRRAQNNQLMLHDYHHLRPGLVEKIDRSIEVLHKALPLALKYDKTDGFDLAFSGGKDSQCLYHVAQLAGVPFKAHFSPTTVDPPEVIQFIRKNYPDCEFGKVKMSIYDKAVENTILPTRKVRWCCQEFKEHSGAGKVTLIGIRHAESRKRAARKTFEVSGHKFSGSYEQFQEWQEKQIRKRYKNLNQDQFSADKQTGVRCISGKDSIIVSPIIDWLEEDVWDFLNGMEIPHCSLYDEGYKRIGCILCPMTQRKQKIKECERWPHVKRKWIDAIMRIRMGESHTEQYGADIRGGGWIDAAIEQAKNITEEEIAERIFDWWISGKSYKSWYAGTIQQLKIDFNNK